MPKIGDRVEINDPELEIQDYGVIKAIIEGEMYPYQILCDHGDEDGHRTLRMPKEYIMLDPTESSLEEPAERLKVIEVVQAKQTFKIGQHYYAKLREGGTHYTVYNHKMVCRGVMPVDMFKNTSFDRIPVPSKSVQDENSTNTLVEVKTSVSKREEAKITITRIVTKIIKEKKIKKAPTHYEKMELLGQMNLFDLEVQ